MFYYKIRTALKKMLTKTPLWKIREHFNKKRLEKHRLFFQLEAEELLKHFSDALIEKNILFWLDFGTLLGYYREHDFIKHDFDLDCGTFLENAAVVQSALLQNGFRLIRQFFSVNDGGMEECYLYKHTTIDVFYYRRDEQKKSIYCNTFIGIDSEFNGYNKKSPCLVNRIDFPDSGFEQTKFKNSIVYVPSNPEIYLKMHYGDNFMIPNKNFNGRKEAQNVTFYTYEEMKGEFITKKVY